MIRSHLVLPALVVSAAVTASAQGGHARARLVSDLADLRADATFHLGVVLEPEPGWHVYWRNPGEAGLATDLDLEVPEGYTVGELEWPAPVVFVQPGGIVGYGYEDPVLIAAEVTAPADPGSTVAVTATASWLACRDVCVLGRAELGAELPLVGEARAAARAAFADWADCLPRPAGPGQLAVSVTGGPMPDTGPAELVVWLSWRSPPGSVELFPDPGPGLKVEGVRTRTRGTLTRVDLTVTRLRGSSAPAATLPSVVVTTDAAGRRRGVAIDIDLD